MAGTLQPDRLTPLLDYLGGAGPRRDQAGRAAMMVVAVEGNDCWVEVDVKVE